MVAQACPHAARTFETPRQSRAVPFRQAQGPEKSRRAGTHSRYPIDEITLGARIQLRGIIDSWREECTNFENHPPFVRLI